VTRPVEVEVLTWNLSKQDAALEKVCKFAANRAGAEVDFVIALQECGDDARAVEDKVDGLRQAGRKVYAVGNGTLVVLASTQLKTSAPRGDIVSGRCVFATTSVGRIPLAIVNYHGMPRGTAGALESVERGGFASELRWFMDEHVGQAPAIVLGDFNVEPWEVEVTSRYCLSFSPKPAPVAGGSHGRSRASLLPVSPRPSRLGPPGTFLLSSTARGEVWHTLDFAAVSDAVELELSIRSQLDAEPLLDSRGKPSLSDHLPVGGMLKLQP
jgi:hypothetical protein